MNIPGPIRLLLGLLCIGILLLAMLFAAAKYLAYQQQKPIRDVVTPALKGIDIDKVNKDLEDYFKAKNRNDPPPK